MAILVDCASCGKRFRAKDAFSGRKVRCPSCQGRLVIEGPRVPNHAVFISYSHNDKAVADAVCATLESRRIRCWIAPRDIVPGASWGSSILEAIEDGSVMVLIYSGNVNLSPQVIREVERAVAKGKLIVPFRIDDAPMSPDLEYFLSASHWFDAMTGPLEEHLERFVPMLQALLAAQKQGGGASGLATPAAAAGAPTLLSLVRQRLRTHWVPVAASLAVVLCLVVVVAVLRRGGDSGRDDSPGALAASRPSHVFPERHTSVEPPGRQDGPTSADDRTVRPVARPEPPTPSGPVGPLPAWREVAAEWRPATPERLEQVRAALGEMVRDLPEYSVADLLTAYTALRSTRSYASHRVSSIPGRPSASPEGQGATLPLSGRFLLTGWLGSAVATGDKVYLWVVPQTSDRMRPGYSPMGYSGSMRYATSPQGIMVVMNAPRVIRWMADYKTGDALRIVVETKDWGDRAAATPTSAAPSSRVPSPKASEALTATLPQFLRFRTSPTAAVECWTFAGLALEKLGRPLTCIDAALGRAATLANAAALANAPSMLFRNMGESLGRAGQVRGVFRSAGKSGDRVVVEFAVPDTLDGDLVVSATMPSQVQIEELGDYEAGSEVEVAATLTFSGDNRYRGAMIPGMPGSRYRYGPSMPDPMMRTPSAPASGAKLPMHPFYQRGASLTVSCDWMQVVGRPSTRVSRTGPRRKVTSLPAVTPDFAATFPTLAVGQSVRWEGTLEDLVCRGDEVHFDVRSTEGKKRVTFEAFAPGRAFLEEVCDFRSGNDVASSAKRDSVIVQGTVRPGDAAAWRLSGRSSSTSTPLVELRSIERAGEPRSRASVGQQRNRSTIVQDRVVKGLPALRRDWPAVGTEVRFTAEYNSYYESDQEVKVRGASHACYVDVRFPGIAQEAFGDYRNDDLVDVVGKVAEGNAANDMVLTGLRIVRKANPLSLVTAGGRPTRRPDYTADKAAWDKAKKAQKDNPGQEVFGVGTVSRVLTTGTDYKISLNYLFGQSGSATLHCPSPASAALAFLKGLTKGDEVLFRGTLTGTSYSPPVTVIWMAKVASPEAKVSFGR